MTERVPTPVVDAIRTGTQQAFAALTEPHRGELRVHCYRILGSFDEAEDMVQETYLQAWRRRDTFEGRAAVRAWLYRIATNTCLQLLRRNPRPTPEPADGRPPLYSSMPWLQPIPDEVLDRAAPSADQPDARAVAKETVTLAFLAVIQLLPPRQRATLLLRDVLGYSAAETASVLDATPTSVNSALQRARATLERFTIAPVPDGAQPSDAAEKALLDRYIAAHETLDPQAIISVLREDARLTITPTGLAWDGRDEITGPYLEGMGLLGEWRCLPIRANRQPAVAHYLRRWNGDGRYEAFSIVVLALSEGHYAELATFAEPALFAAFGLPEALT